MKNLLTVLKYLLFLSIGIGLLWLTFRNQSLGETLKKLRTADIRWISLGLVFSILALFSRAYRWNLLIHPLGFRPKLINTFHALMIGYFANLAIPRIGEISRCAALKKAENVPIDKLIGTVIIERVSDVVMLMLSILLVLSIEFQLLGGFLNEHFFAPIMLTLRNSLLSFSIAGIIIALLIFLFFRYIKKNKENQLIKKIKKLVDGIMEGLKTILTMKNRGVFLLHTLFIWFMYFAMTYISFKALQSTEDLDMKAGLFIMVLGGIGMSAPVQGGIGTYHFLVSQGLLLYGIAADNGIVFATLVHTWQMIICVMFGLIAWLSIFVFPKKKKHETP